jgi:hypothetical protein
LQLWFPPLQALWPLQLLPPTHLTLAWLAPLDESCANTGEVKNIAPTAAAKIAPVNVFLSIALLIVWVKWPAVLTLRFDPCAIC